MPINDVPGRFNWGYDGVLLNAPNARYGRPEDLKRLLRAAHALDIMVYLDVVYNHFGPQLNYLHLYAKNFFTTRHSTGWGPAVNLEGRDGAFVREFLIELAETVRSRLVGRHVHLMLENEANRAGLLDRAQGRTTRLYDAQWGDD